MINIELIELAYDIETTASIPTVVDGDAGVVRIPNKIGQDDTTIEYVDPVAVDPYVIVSTYCGVRDQVVGRRVPVAVEAVLATQALLMAECDWYAITA